MSTCVYMMVAAKVEAELEPRLGRLTGGDAGCCVPEYQNLAQGIQKARSFRTTLARARALSDERRLLAVAMLRRRNELCACEIQAGLGVSHATVSHHMRVLEDAGLVHGTRRGKWMYYSLTAAGAEEVR
jgi:DNA-binding transcriptional ArsR family regulator